MESKSLRELWEETEKLKDSSSTDEKTRSEIVEGYEKCLKLVLQLRIFSSNEEVDEIKTSELRYLMIDYELAKCVEQWTKGDRLKAVQYAKTHYETFLSICDDYGLKPMQDEKPKTEADTRTLKIARYRMRQNLEKELKVLSKDSETNEEQERKFWLTKLQIAVEDTLDSLPHIEMEIDLLKRAQAELMKSEDSPEKDEETLRREERKQKEESSWRLDLNTRDKILDKNNRPLQPFTIVSDRNETRKNVFGFGYNLPTMTVDEYLDEEMKRGNIISQKDNPPKSDSDDEDDYEKLDAKTMKDRYWDEFKEANPRGSGNTMVNRG